MAFSMQQLPPLIALMECPTQQESDDSHTRREPQRQTEHSTQQAHKATDQHTVDHGDHGSGIEEDLPPGGMHPFLAYDPFPIIMGGEDKVGLHLWSILYIEMTYAVESACIDEVD